jgi:hypothetical protein
VATRREAHAPDGRIWTVARRPRGELVLARLLRSEGWIVEATTVGPPGERRTWEAPTGGEAGALVERVAMALRTGAEAPPEDPV